MNKKTKIVIISLVALLFLMLLLRGPLLRLYVSHKTKYLKDHYSLIISYDKLKMSGLAGIRIEQLCIYPVGGDTLFSANYIHLRMNPFKLLFLTTDLRRLDAAKIKINFVKKDSLTSNFDFLFKDRNGKDKETDTLKGINGQNYARTVDKMLSLILRVIPAKADINGLDINYIYGEYKLKIDIPDFKVNHNKFNAKITSLENGNKEVLFSEGILDDSKKKISARIYARDSSKFSVPFINFRWGAKVQFDTLAFELSGSQRRNDTMSLSGKALASGVSLFHKRVSYEDVILDKGIFNYKINIGKNYFELDSSSTAIVNKFSFSPYMKAEKIKKWHITASLNKRDFAADDLFSSLPKGMFYNLEGIKTEGRMDYHFYLDLDFAQIDSLKLESSLKSHNFKVLHFGKSDLRRMNGDFEYTAYENESPVRSFIVGESNPNFRTLDRISPFLQMAVLQSEDGGFFYHDGFLLESIKGALVEDIKEKRFERGGSTISMQLVKNVFLSRNKTLARKFEEMMIVWLIENNRLSSKTRMFEVYLNIIEWGPMVYGANEAARFYFDKDAKDIDINEAIFLASIIPSPKRALGSFTDDLQLKPSLEGYYKLLAQRFRVKGLINVQEEEAIRPEVKIAGEAKRLLMQREAKILGQD